MKFLHVEGAIELLEDMAADPEKYWDEPKAPEKGPRKSARIMRSRVTPALEQAYRLRAALADINEEPFKIKNIEATIEVEE